MRDRYELYVLARELGQVILETSYWIRLPTGMRFESSLVANSYKLVSSSNASDNASTKANK